MITSITEFGKMLAEKAITEKQHRVEVESPDSEQLANKLSGVKGINSTGMVTVKKLNVYYDDKKFNEKDVKDLVAKLNKGIKEN